MGTKAAAIAIVGALAVIGLVWGSAVLIKGYLLPKPQFYSDIKNVDIKTYSVSGEVKSISGTEFTIEAGLVVVGKQGNELRFFGKKAVADGQTKVFRRVAPGKPDFTGATLTDIEPGQNITVYTGTNPYEEDSFKTDRIEIN